MNVLQFAPNSITYIGQQFGNYRIVKLLGQGGSAAVYLAIHRYLNTQAAVKILHTQPGGAERQRFLIEARISAQLVHPHVVRVLEFGLQDGVTFLVMEYAPNGSLRQLHLREQTLSSKVVLHYVRQIADGLQYIHRRGLIHQDVKPENLLVGHNYQILLSDFGIAITANKPNAFYKRTIVGTAAYMAPEQIQGNSCFASDQYALATMVYEWLCGDVPFQGSWLGIAQQQLYSAPPSLREKVSTIPPTVERVIVRALAKKPEQRFRSVQEFVAALEQTSIERFSVSYSIPEPGSACRYLLKVEEKPATSQLLSIRNGKNPSCWRDVAVLFATNLLLVAVIGAILNVLHIEAQGTWWLLSLWLTGFSFVGAVITKNQQALILGGCIFSVALFPGLGLHSVLTFLATFITLLLLSTLLTFNLSLHRS